MNAVLDSRPTPPSSTGRSANDEPFHLGWWQGNLADEDNDALRRWSAGLGPRSSLSLEVPHSTTELAVIVEQSKPAVNQHLSISAQVRDGELVALRTVVMCERTPFATGIIESRRRHAARSRSRRNGAHGYT